MLKNWDQTIYQKSSSLHRSSPCRGESCSRNQRGSFAFLDAKAIGFVGDLDIRYLKLFLVRRSAEDICQDRFICCHSKNFALLECKECLGVEKPSNEKRTWLLWRVPSLCSAPDVDPFAVLIRFPSRSARVFTVPFLTMNFWPVKKRNTEVDLFFPLSGLGHRCGDDIDISFNELGHAACGCNRL